MIRVLVLGQPYFGTRIAHALDSLGGDMRATFVAQGSYLRLLARPPRAEPVVLIRAGYRAGATTPRGRLFDAYWSMVSRSLPDAVRCHYWLGSDVMDTLDEARAGTLRSAALAATRDDLHLADAPWLASELEAVDLSVIPAHVPRPYHAPEDPPALPTEFRVLTYLPTRRFEFYGGTAILDAARRMPNIRFDVVASDGEQVKSSPSNVQWHGWVADMAARYAGATVVVRIPRHDGLGATVVEGLLHARHVIYTHDVPFVRTIWPASAHALADALGELEDAHRAGQLAPNLAGRSYAMDEFDETREANRLAALVRERV
jgi:hypothetical protein